MKETRYIHAREPKFASGAEYYALRKGKIVRVYPSGEVEVAHKSNARVKELVRKGVWLAYEVEV